MTEQLSPDALQFSETVRRYGGKGAYERDLAAGRTALPYERWVQIRTPAFKAEFGDWETLKRQNEIDAFMDNAIAANDPKDVLEFREVVQDEILAVQQATGINITGYKHEFSAQDIKHAFNKHKDDSQTEPDQRSLTLLDLKRIPVVLDGYDNIHVKAAGPNRTSVIYSKRFSGDRMEYVERLFETSNNRKPRLSTKTVWVKSPTGAVSGPPWVSTPKRSSVILPFSHGRINPADISADLNVETGEPNNDFLVTNIPSPLIDLRGLGCREAARKLHYLTRGNVVHLPLIEASIAADGSKQLDVRRLLAAQRLHPTPRKDEWLKAVIEAPQRDKQHHRQQDWDMTR